MSVDMERVRALIAQLNEIGEAMWSTNAFRGRQCHAIADELEALLAQAQPAPDYDDLKRQLIDYIVESDGEDSVEMLVQGILTIVGVKNVE